MKITKALTSFALSIIILISVLPYAYADSEYNSFMLADMNSDGKITAADALSALRIAALIDKPDELDILRGDIDADGEITPPDARRILRTASKIEDLQETAQPAIITKMTNEPFCVDIYESGKTVKDQIISSAGAVSVKTYEKEASERTNNEKIDRRIIIVSAGGNDDGEYDVDCVHSQHIAYSDEIYGSSFDDYSLYFGLLKTDKTYSVMNENTSFTLRFNSGAEYKFTLSSGKITNMTSSLNGETINIPVADIHFNECDALKPLGESDDITSDYFNDFIASAAADELEVEFASGDSDIYVTQNIKLPKRIVSYPAAEIEWTSMSGAVTNDGVITRDKNDVIKAELDAEITVGSTKKQKKFTVEIMPENTLETMENTADDIKNMNGGNDVFVTDSDGRVTLIDGVCSEIKVENFSDALAVLTQNAGVLGADKENARFVPLSSKTNEFGSQYTFRQFFADNEVYLRRVTLSVNKDGICDYIASSVLENDVLKNIEKADITVDKAVETAENLYNGEINADSAELYVYALNEYKNAPIYTYIVDISGYDKNGYYISDEVFIDARSGKIIKTESRNDSGIALTGSGADEHGKIQTFPSIINDFYTYKMEDPERNIRVYAFLDDSAADRSFSQLMSFDNTFDDSSAVSAYLNIIKVYNAFRDKFGIDSYDGRGSVVSIAVHDNSYNDNAFWDSDSSTLIFCDNSNENKSKTTVASALDIVSHEYSHAVIESTAGVLPYEKATGAINEAYADIFACFVDGNWTLGEDWNTVRDISNPNKYETPSEMYGKYFVDYNKTDDGDLGGVHTNSTVISHCAYLMSRYSLDSNTLEKLWYQSLSLGYDGISDFSTVRRNVTKAAELMNLSDGEKDIINKAFDKVKIKL